MSPSTAMNELQTQLAKIPYARFLGFEVRAEGEQLFGCLPFAESLIGNPRIRALHGGVVGAALELTAICELLRQPRVVAIPRIVTITVEYLRSAQAADRVISARPTSSPGRRSPVTAAASPACASPPGRTIRPSRSPPPTPSFC
jgi:acyl-coenzyme A thioesterase PaaI-like protein